MKRWKVGVNKVDCGWICQSYEEDFTCAHEAVTGPCRLWQGQQCQFHCPVTENGLVAFLDMGEEWAKKHGTQFEDNKEDIAAILLMNNVLFLSSRIGVYEHNGEQQILPETLILLLNCNDTFAWGCADAEEVTYKELSDLYKIWLKDKVWGTTAWVCKKRNQQPQEPIKNRMIELGIWDESLEALPENHYTKYLREEADKTK